MFENVEFIQSILVLQLGEAIVYFHLWWLNICLFIHGAYTPIWTWKLIQKDDLACFFFQDILSKFPQQGSVKSYKVKMMKHMLLHN